MSNESEEKNICFTKTHIAEIQLYHFVYDLQKNPGGEKRPETWHLKGANQQTWKGANPAASYDFYSPSKITNNQNSKKTVI